MPLKMLTLPVLVAYCVCLAPWAQAAEDHAQNEQAIRAAAQRYIQALEAGDTKTLLEMWTPDGDIIDEYGRATPAREMLMSQRPKGESSDKPASESHAKISDTSLRFVTDKVAIEDGQAVVQRPGGLPPREGRFTAIWVKRDNRWQLASLREVRLPKTPADDLAALDWMVGRWTGQGGKATFDMAARWNEQHTYLIRDLRVTHEGKVILDGQQRIGVDPLDGQIKSWMYDADGGHGEGTWARHGDSWVVQATGVSPGGRRTTATNVYTHDSDGTFTWKSLGATSNGQPTEDFEIKLHRVQGVE
jgi:uncharacterized protein (TIGR02246 family)